MKYYSRSPEELRKRHEELSSSPNRKRFIGRLILFLDIALVLGIIFYISNLKQNDRDTERQFDWQGTQIKTGCDGAEACYIKLLKISDDYAQVEKITWQLKDITENEVIYETTTTVGDYTEENRIELPSELAPEHRLKARLLTQTGEKLSFRVFP